MIFQVLVLCCLLSCVWALSKDASLLVVSYDAFRYNFVNKSITPHLFTLREHGTFAEYLDNIFPTKTFPNHHSIATGLYAESHGVVGNHAYDPVSKKFLSIRNYELFHYNENIEPIWRLNEKAGDGRHSGVIMWPGGTFPYQGKNVTYTQEFNPKVDFFKRVDTALSWFKDPERPANLVMLYIEQPDTLAHIFGPNSEQVADVIRKLDNVSHYIKEQLEKHDLSETVNVIHLSDHGLSGVTVPRMINLTQYLEPGTYDIVAETPCLHYFPHQGYEEVIYNKLKNVSEALGTFKVYKKTEIPSRWHFTSNNRIPPIYVVAEDGYGFQDLKASVEKWAPVHGIQVTNRTEFGSHGYDNANKNMKPYFLAYGPKIRKNNQVAPFNTVDLFSLFCEILEIGAAPNNGSFENIANILINENSDTEVTTLVVVGGVLLVVLLIIVFVTSGALLLIKHNQKMTTEAALNKRFPHSSIEVQHLLESEDA